MNNNASANPHLLQGLTAIRNGEAISDVYFSHAFVSGLNCAYFRSEAIDCKALINIGVLADNAMKMRSSELQPKRDVA